jgi:sRNA-binding protein
MEMNLMSITPTTADEMITTLRKRWPLCFCGPKPLMIGIFESIKTAAPDLDAAEISAALAAYTRTVPYLRALTVEKAKRVNLEGEPVGVVNPPDAEYAETMLQKRMAARGQREGMGT